MRKVLLLAWLPMGIAVLGAWIDEQRALGVTNWRSACRASGISVQSVAAFTLELLPTAVIGALLGGLLVLAAGLRDTRPRARNALAAHMGCLAAMPLGLLLCASALPWPLTLLTELALTAMAAFVVWWFMHIRKPTYSNATERGVPRISNASTATENFSVTHPWNAHDCN